MTTYSIDDDDLERLRTIRSWILDPRRGPTAREALGAWIENLAPDADPPTLHVFLVEGYGPFPWNGLQVAKAWPHASVDAHAIRRSGDRRVIAWRAPSRRTQPSGTNTSGRCARSPCPCPSPGTAGADAPTTDQEGTS